MAVGGGRGELRGQGPIKMNGTANLGTVMRRAGSGGREREREGEGGGGRGRERVGALRYFLASVYVCLTFSCRLPRSVHGLGANGDRHGGIAAARVSQRSFFPLLPPLEFLAIVGNLADGARPDAACSNFERVLSRGVSFLRAVDRMIETLAGNVIKCAALSAER